MRFLFTTDSHVKKTAPYSRADNYFDTCLTKLEEVFMYAVRNSIRVIIHGGDIFDGARPSYEVFNAVATLIAKYGVRLLINPGNHDLFAWNPDTIYRTGLYALSLLPNVGIFEDCKLEALEANTDEGWTIQVYSIWSKFDREGDASVFEVPGEPDRQNRYVIVLAHTMLVPNSFPAEHVTMEQLPWKNGGDLILGSHYHPGLGIKEYRPEGRKMIVAGPGSLLRLVKSTEQRTPCFYDIAIERTSELDPPWETTILVVPLACAQEWPFKEEVEPLTVEQVEYGPQFEMFLERLLGSNFDAAAVDPRTLATEIAKEQGFPENVLRRVLQNLATAQEER